MMMMVNNPTSAILENNKKSKPTVQGIRIEGRE
jgi:hypothetical protein